MISATDLKNGITFLSDGKPYRVIKYSLIKMGRGGATVKVTARNLETGSVTEKSFSSNAAVDEVNTHKKKLQYLYKTGNALTFMDPKTYEQVEIPLSILAEQAAFLKEGESVDVLFWDEKALSLELPPKITLKVVESDPGVKGNSATNIYKPAVLENGLNLKVPLFIKVGDQIKVDTRTGEYLERAK
ncbi:MAG: Elongation factor P [Candidatus Woesebacteria bacterium GW2011_GWC2_47_16]|uniref:Elongation factor P n=8 Tax=Candidatus Woeseibacteriota TaxID=1752722 RepID=A0A0G1QWY9_9BACT|nr:MAG: Elongation factor P [Candidatus Woesebacteria bacterium GW2011_GWF1_46_13]KKU49389.1 MAG: Elongation factor P [Candidatus Woesebacteria bacterium GW2011_GWF2_46_8]KKU65201.1 MAG: Elongation factor P [Candidatus Woesebacteria bacterium GW2011_GWC2_47_16]KKU71014.1 MAG: Elongation factor P [Candidatus Woesebacteria bacterium GW2011_GWD1_47_21]OGM78662.1 MAG: elongation factor P [Candidatus Woesebacteria bacterium RIFOXYA1_FULL_48_16]OGM83959.1 MAG: elongation factor P [Candidatus Woeseba